LLKEKYSTLNSSKPVIQMIILSDFPHKQTPFSVSLVFIAKLNRLGIHEKDQKITNPKIEIRLTPFLFYKVTGTISANIGKGILRFEYYNLNRIMLRN
jgi:hypothetical protein